MFGKTASLVRLMCKPREATILWLHLACVKPPMASGPASHVKPVTKQTFGRASPGATREAAPEALPNGAEIGWNGFSTILKAVWLEWEE